MGIWDESLSTAKNLLKNPTQPTIVKIGALSVLAAIEIRKGLPEALLHLQEVRSCVMSTEEHYQIIPVMVASLQYEWLMSENLISTEDLTLCISLVQKVNNISLNSELQFWLGKARGLQISLQEIYEPYRLLQEGKTNAAASFWKNKGCPFEQAISLYEGNEENKKNALQIFLHLGADAIAEKLKMEMRAVGIKNIPRGIRESTRSNPAQLTNREVDILHLLQQGFENKKIANTLFISPKTAENHISNILFKLDVNSRNKAVAEGIRLGILK